MSEFILLVFFSEWLGPLTFSMYAFGYTFGTPVLGGVSDARGRKFVIFASLLATIMCNQMGAMADRLEKSKLSMPANG